MGFADRLRAIPRGPAWVTNLALVLFGLVFIDLTWTGAQEYHRYIHGFSQTIFGQMMLYLGAIGLVERSPVNRWTLPIVLAVAFGARVVAVAHPPFLSTDIYRYVWDGMVQNHGINPYRYIPADPHLGFLRDAHIYPHINRRNFAHTIYPPASEFLFMVVTRLSATVVFMKLVMVAMEAVTCYALIRSMRLLAIPAERIVIYAWHPVCIWQIASSGHIDAAAITVIALALLACLQNKPLRATMWGAMGMLVKFYPALLLPAVVRKRLVIPAALFTGIVVVGYLPYLSVGTGVLGYLSGYAREEGVDSGKRFFAIDAVRYLFHFSIPSGVYIALSAILLGGLGIWAWRRGLAGPACISSGLVLATALMLCFSPHYAWYFLWLMPFLALWPWRPAFFMVMCVSYLLSTHLGAAYMINRMNERLYGGFLLFLALELVLHMRGRRLERNAAREQEHVSKSGKPLLQATRAGHARMTGP